MIFRKYILVFLISIISFISVAAQPVWENNEFKIYLENNTLKLYHLKNEIVEIKSFGFNFI